MRVPQRVDYALRALTALAQQPPDASVAAGELARRLRLPTRFLEQQVTLLSKRGLVTCRRGSAGGCALARSAEDISVADIVEAIQGDILDVPHTTGSAVAAMWVEASETLASVLRDITLRDLAERQSQLDESGVAMYYI